MKNQKGLSMVELMVAMALSLILMVGVTQIFISNKKTFDIAHDLGLMQENGRIAAALLSESIRNTDHWHSIEADEVAFGTTNLTSHPTGCGAAWVFNHDFPVRGFEGDSSITAVANFPANCIAATDYEPNTDIIVLRYADGRAMLSETGIDETTNDDRYLIRTSVGQSAYVFKGSDSSTAKSQISFGPSVYNMEYAVEVYFIRPCSIQVAGVCKDDIPALVRLYLDEDNFQQEVIVEGVEQLQFEYGIDGDGDLDVDSYVTASAIANTVDAWETVMSVRMSLIARSLKRDIDYDDSVNADGNAKEYLMVGDMATSGSGFKVPAADKHYRRKQYQREIHIRNRGRL